MQDAESRPIRVVIVEDYKLFRVGIQSVLDSDPEIDVVGEAEDGEAGLEVIRSMNPDVVLVDLGIPKRNGLEMLRLLKRENTHSKVIILTSHHEEEDVLSALRAGANAYCIKDIPSVRLLEVIKSVYEGALWLDPAVAQVALDLFHLMESAVDSSKISPRFPKPVLTERETKILHLMVEGYNNQRIADNLYLSVHTVKVYISSILQKLSVQDRVQAVVKAIRENII